MNKKIYFNNNGYLIKIEILIIVILTIVLSILIKGIYMQNTVNKIVDTEVVNIVNNELKDFNANNSKNEEIDYSKLSYYIKVNIKSQIVIIYTCDENNNYVIPIKTMICSTGKDTPQSGVFNTTDKYEWRELFGKVYGQYATRITGPILFHSVPYQSQDKASLEYWEYDKLGQPASLGCVRLTVEDAKWIYDYCDSGTKVEFCSDDINYKLNIDEPIKISDYNEVLRKWDPTDPDEKNPWLKYNKEL